MGATGNIHLSFDTATDDVVVGVARDDEILAAASLSPAEGGRPRHASALLAEIERCVEEAGGWDIVERIGIGVGPGTYTGLRIGIATGLALGQGRRLPLVAVGTLSALAAGIADHANDPDRTLLPVLDARRDEVFVQLHSGDGEPLGEPAVIRPGDVPEWLAGAADSELANGSRPPLAGGSGAVRFRRELEAAGIEPIPSGEPANRLSAAGLCRAAAAVEPVSPERIRPIYLREPDAKRWLERDRS